MLSTTYKQNTSFISMNINVFSGRLLSLGRKVINICTRFTHLHLYRLFGSAVKNLHFVAMKFLVLAVEMEWKLIDYQKKNLKTVCFLQHLLEYWVELKWDVKCLQMRTMNAIMSFNTIIWCAEMRNFVFCFCCCRFNPRIGLMNSIRYTRWFPIWVAFFAVSMAHFHACEMSAVFHVCFQFIVSFFVVEMKLVIICWLFYDCLWKRLTRGIECQGFEGQRNEMRTDNRCFFPSSQNCSEHVFTIDSSRSCQHNEYALFFHNYSNVNACKSSFTHYIQC